MPLALSATFAACTGSSGSSPEPQPSQNPEPVTAEPQPPLDSGAPDTGLVDAGRPDAGPLDAGPPPVFDAGPPPPLDCGDDDPLTNREWVGFCEDRVDDNCTVDSPAIPCGDFPTVHNFCRTADEDCPSTRPASAPPTWDCILPAPPNVIAYSSFTTNNAQVASFCAYVYESTEFAGEHYVAVDVRDGNVPNGPDSKCADDYSARRHFFLSDLKDAEGNTKDCAPVRYGHAYPQENPTGTYYPVDEQKLSNRCRKAIRNIVRNVQSNFNPDIQYFAASREEALGKLAILDSAEVGCIGIDDLQGEPYRVNEVWVVQAASDVILTGN